MLHLITQHHFLYEIQVPYSTKQNLSYHLFTKKTANYCGCTSLNVRQFWNTYIWASLVPRLHPIFQCCMLKHWKIGWSLGTRPQPMPHGHTYMSDLWERHSSKLNNMSLVNFVRSKQGIVDLSSHSNNQNDNYFSYYSHIILNALASYHSAYSWSSG